MYYRDCDDYVSRLCRLRLPEGTMQIILESPKGLIRDPDVHYDGKTIVFAHAPAGAANYRLCRIQADGSGLTNLTEAAPQRMPRRNSAFETFMDIEPCWTPDDRIMFCSTRSNRMVPCNSGARAATLFSCRADGSDIRQMSANVETENSPTMMPDGRVLFTRWEYVDRSLTGYKHLWRMNPDGTVASIVHGNQPRGNSTYLDARPVPGSGEIVFVRMGHVPSEDHTGHLSLLAAQADPDDVSAVTSLGGERMPRKDLGKLGRDLPFGHDPLPLSANWFLYANRDAFWLLHRDGRQQCVFRLGPDALERLPRADSQFVKRADCRMGVHEPRLLRPRTREPVLPNRVNWSATTGRLFLTNAQYGRSMQGVQPGEIRRILVLETVPKPFGHGTGGQCVHPTMGDFFVKRTWGEFPVEKDGSAYVEVPARRPLQLIALDQDGREVKRMSSFLSVMPGETLSCVGCHERRRDTGSFANQALALQRPPSTLTLMPGVPSLTDYPRDVQPIVSRHCATCHTSEKMLGKIDLSANHGGGRELSYLSMTGPCFLPYRFKGSPSWNKDFSDQPAHSTGWKMMDHFLGRAKGHEKIALSPAELRTIQYWAATPGQYLGSYFAGHAEYNHSAHFALNAIMEKRCGSCHKDESFYRPPFSTHKLNLVQPELSLALRAPLDAKAGGLGWCKNKDGSAIFAGTQDPDYQAILAVLVKHRSKPDEVRVKTGVGNGDIFGFTVPAGSDPYTAQQAYWKVAYPEHREAQDADSRPAAVRQER
jgi:hypothetical protein